MTQPTEPVPPFLAEPSKLGQEISITGEWTPAKPGGLFRNSADSQEMLNEWEDIHGSAKGDGGVLSTEINHAVGEDAVLVHHVFKNPDGTGSLFYHNRYATYGRAHQGRKAAAASHSNVSIPAQAREALLAKNVPAVFDETRIEYVRDDYRSPDKKTAIIVIAKWTCKPGDASHTEDLKYRWQRVGTEAHSIEKGLLRFEAYEVIGEDVLIIHEAFENTAELKFHLTKGTAEKYRKDIDEIATPECY